MTFSPSKHASTSGIFWFGIIFGLLASCLQSAGITIQRKSHVLNERLPEGEKRVEHRRPLWLLGFAVFISSNVVGSLVQIASLPVVILAPLGAVSLLWNAFFAHLILGDVFSPWMILGTLFIAGGAVLIAIFGIVPEPTRSLEDLLGLFRRPAFVAYFSLLGAVVVISLVITHIAEYSLSRRVTHSDTESNTPNNLSFNLPEDPSVLTTGITDTITETITTERTPLLDRKSPQSPSLNLSRRDPDLRSINRTRLILAISYASFSGIISGMCLLFAKSGVELLLLTLRGDNQFWRWQAWVLVLGLVAFALLQLWYLHKALVLASPTLVCPSAFCFYNLSSILNGLVYFNQFSLIPPLHLCLVVLGIVILLGGVWIVSIQSGDGEVEPWNGDNDISDEEMVEEAAPSEPEITLSDSPTEPTLPRYIRRPEVEELPWGSRSEPIMPLPAATGLGLDLGLDRPLPPQPTISLSEASERIQQSHTASSNAGQSRRRRPTMDDYTLLRRHRRIPSYTGLNSHSHLHNLQLSPPLNSRNTVSTLAGAGFQIGLSAVSPGFSIVPRERRRRTSGFGVGASISGDEADVARRRTVSEGNVRTDVVLDSECRDREDGADPVAQRSPKGKGKGKSTRRWAWLRRTFMERD
ncbi:uncharacterized protein EV420DRAFT_1262004 [Desarmillaria tabescens]|uniref:DUF803-domain-containing protein n=1 Tax=Armillaria tabescens TaxID=1929756 RepID=A0AA39U191_ARMTA|nr:uncharacterized protein EV420DRAFT_1262004 [Desarmillaria tabescens]KAK0465030.1 hypothetical protein EV420DRAFT_1262004 [Desarmillaria tabescens]